MGEVLLGLSFFSMKPRDGKVAVTNLEPLTLSRKLSSGNQAFFMKKKLILIPNMWVMRNHNVLTSPVLKHLEIPQVLKKLRCYRST